uniref:Ribosomal protein S20 n=1 Tax=Campylaephora sungminbooi TaxID=1896769 RepID=A0A1B0RRS8_9FLOR|nr:ribosomal protein S20 [Campylaephora sungminbooi]AKU47458.1 ribosomal protein S20 [Campylaephora sungminbooi]ALN11905.1 ribosomal protein S20 [Campylaephora sungminbooi]
MRKNLSAVKKNQIAIRNRQRNKIYKSSIKTSTKKYLYNLENSHLFSVVDLSTNLSLVYQKIDKAVKRGVLHKNKAARKKAVLAKIMQVKLAS